MAPKCISTFISFYCLKVWGISTIHFYAGEVASGRSLPKSQQEEDDPLQMGGDFTLSRWMITYHSRIIFVRYATKFCSPQNVKFSHQKYNFCAQSNISPHTWNFSPQALLACWLQLLCMNMTELSIHFENFANDDLQHILNFNFSPAQICPSGSPFQTKSLFQDWPPSSLSSKLKPKRPSKPGENNFSRQRKFEKVEIEWRRKIIMISI